MPETDSSVVAQSRQLTTEDFTRYGNVERCLPDFAGMVPLCERLGKVTKSTEQGTDKIPTTSNFHNVAPKQAHRLKKQLQAEKYPAGFGFSSEKVLACTFIASREARHFAIFSQLFVSLLPHITKCDMMCLTSTDLAFAFFAGASRRDDRSSGPPSELRRLQVYVVLCRLAR